MNETGKSILDTPLTAKRLCEMISSVEKGVISNSAAKRVMQIVIDEDKEPQQIIEELGLVQNSDVGFLENLAREVLAKNEKSVNDYKNGKTNAMGYLIGQCMKESKGKANPGMIKEIVIKLLEE
jgi:aspartyl-tRNA(Asn)/glutamyl-tRNA(Gln) amidotransferase subunit B